MCVFGSAGFHRLTKMAADIPFECPFSTLKTTESLKLNPTKIITLLRKKILSAKILILSVATKIY